MELIKIKNINRYQIAEFLNNNHNIGIELGVAEGYFSHKMMESEKFFRFYGVDSYDNFPHNHKEFLRTKKKLSKFKNYKLIKNTFHNSLSIFSNNYFDFIYIDGFAHNGNEKGKTLIDWFNKVKIGGIISGDDFHPDWPIVQETITEFCKKFDFELFVTNTYDTSPYAQYPSWFFFKTKEVDLHTINFKDYLITQNKRKSNFSFYYLKYKSKLYYLLKNILGDKKFNFLISVYKKIIRD